MGPVGLVNLTATQRESMAYLLARGRARKYGHEVPDGTAKVLTRHGLIYEPELEKDDYHSYRSYYELTPHGKEWALADDSIRYRALEIWSKYASAWESMFQKQAAKLEQTNLSGTVKQWRYSSPIMWGMVIADLAGAQDKPVSPDWLAALSQRVHVNEESK